MATAGMGPEDPDKAQEATVQAKEEDKKPTCRKICKEPLPSKAKYGNQVFRQAVAG